MTENRDGVARVAAPSSWRDWQQWVAGVDWSDWRSWLQRVASTDWAAGQWPGTEWERERAPSAGEISLTLRAWEEEEPGERIREHLAASWPVFRRWWREGPNTRPTAGQARARLEEHMPELVPAWQRLAGMLAGDSEAAAALALWNPPPFVTGCSQAAVLPDGPALIRNYDWDYRLFDGVVARTAYTGRRVVGMLDCLWGLLDGINDAGLAVSLAFGGRPEVGEGFGIPLVIRYVLEVCGTVDEAMQVLRRMPVHMSYNVTALDRSGRWATAYLAPDRPARIASQAVATNHQGQVEWAPYAAAIRSVEREERLAELLAERTGASGVVAACWRRRNCRCCGSSAARSPRSSPTCTASTRCGSGSRRLRGCRRRGGRTISGMGQCRRSRRCRSVWSVNRCRWRLILTWLLGLSRLPRAVGGVLGCEDQE